MTTSEVRTQVGQIRLSYWLGNITAADAKNQLQNINWISVSGDTEISVVAMQNIVNDTITQLDDGTL